MSRKSKTFHFTFLLAVLLLATIATASVTTVDYGLATHTVTGTHSICNNNNICEYLLSENQDNCPHDCYTTVTMSPSFFLLPGQRVGITISFNDSRYVAGKTTNIAIEIYDNSLKLEKNWDESSSCLSNLNFTADANCIDCGCSKEGVSYKCHSSTQSTIKATSVNGYFKLTAECSVPSGIIAGSKILEATPVFYSEPIRLKPSTNKFTIMSKEVLNLILQLYNLLLKLP